MKFTLMDYEAHLFLKLDQSPEKSVTYSKILDSIVENGDLGRDEASEILISVIRRLIYRGKISVPLETENLILFSKLEPNSEILSQLIIHSR